MRNSITSIDLLRDRFPGILGIGGPYEPRVKTAYDFAMSQVKSGILSVYWARLQMKSDLEGNGSFLHQRDSKAPGYLFAILKTFWQLYILVS